MIKTCVYIKCVLFYLLIALCRSLYQVWGGNFNARKIDAAQWIKIKEINTPLFFIQWKELNSWYKNGISCSMKVKFFFFNLTRENEWKFIKIDIV